MRRRDFLRVAGAAAAAWPLTVRGQQSRSPVIGFLSGAAAGRSADRVRAFKQGLSETGYVEGQNVAVEYCWAEDDSSRFPALAADLIRRHVSVIAALDGGAALAAKQATATIPIVFRLGVDPIKAGLVASLNRPAGNVTGVVSLSAELGAKLLELLREFVPPNAVIGLLAIPGKPNSQALSRDLPAAARALGLQIQIVHASSDSDFDSAFAALAQSRARGLVIAPELIFTSHSAKLAALAARQSIPTIYYFREFAAAGGLMTYGNSLSDSYRLAGVYTGRILKGEKPADLPVQQSTKVELVINLKTANALGLTIPIPLLGRADEVIE